MKRPRELIVVNVMALALLLVVLLLGWHEAAAFGLAVLGIMDRAYATRISNLLGLAAQNGIEVETLAKEIAFNNSVRRQEELNLKLEKKRWYLTKIRKEKNIKPMIERIASVLYRKLRWRKILRRKAVGNAYRNAIGDVKYYDQLYLD